MENLFDAEHLDLNELEALRIAHQRKTFEIEQNYYKQKQQRDKRFQFFEHKKKLPTENYFTTHGRRVDPPPHITSYMHNPTLMDPEDGKSSPGRREYERKYNK